MDSARLGSRLRSLRIRNDFNQEELGARVGLTGARVSLWESGTNPPTLPTLRQLAVIFDVPLSYFLDEAATEELSETAIEIRSKVPVISWVQAGDWQEIQDMYELGDGEGWVPSVVRTGSRAFALRVHGDSMAPEFLEGDIVVVDPDRRAENGSYIIARLDNEAEATFKQLVIDGGTTYLKPLNPRYPILTVETDATIVGVVVSKTKIY